MILILNINYKIKKNVIFIIFEIYANSNNYIIFCVSKIFKYKQKNL